MTLQDKHLAPDEHVVLELRTHAKVMFWPMIVLVLLAAAVVAGWVLWPGAGAWVVTGVVVVAAVIWVGAPWLRWMSTSYTVTNKRVATRSGLVARKGRDIPLYRINDISFDQGLLDRAFGCGTLIIADASEKAGMSLHDVPDVEAVQVRIQELLFAHDDGTDDGEHPPTEPPHGARR
ncbi:PH domain-containing protein [Luteimicrobium subarcticum]|uniref:PH (Pleckstrin Homology) domain-containing protein n=1 Tax=Luteimicrobium subarcticum TaxID=620910 RepID=A0A2M8W6S9_9MICO|nr:PH domain-containing protein [Luteimicrobium subarcticum]PJI86637.1 PH (Pleckstrin Homology) domain-containing protein [Luteimicrobium subarcticum]